MLYWYLTKITSIDHYVDIIIRMKKKKDSLLNYYCAIAQER